MPQAPILDLRDARAFSAGHPSAAANIPWNELPRRMHELPPKGTLLLIYHDSSELAQQAVSLLQDRGYLVQLLEHPELSKTGPSTRQLWRPSPFLLEALQFIAADPPSSRHAADLGCGAGREAVHLAACGWDVDAFDLLPDALAKANDLAARSGVRLNTICADLQHQGPTKRYSLICCFRFLPRELLPQIGNWLGPGGYVVVETFHSREMQNQQRRHAAGRLLQDGELPKLLKDLEIILARDQVERDGRCFSQVLARRR